MDRDYTYILWIMTVIIGIVSYIPYIRDMFRWTTKPHVFSWFLRWIASLILFIGKWDSGAGAWSRANLLLVGVCFFIAGYGLSHDSSKYITLSDYIVGALALLAFVLYFLTDGRFRPMFLINITDILSFIPSIRKSWYDPLSETSSMYLISGIKFCLMLFATAEYSFITLSNTILWIFLNFSFVMFLHIRRRQLSNPKFIIQNS